ncbi:hypothetical protein P7K49_014873 [Saguinus oedipus]|uniref:Uncharacterized protein n=1 Tax=Saguinus oedipus TaxID=9490 RepID=A0ABQ9V7L9_SAGOE|nr:hypothetical protein P7K49_014873 [Saguinus oedipus]
MILSNQKPASSLEISSSENSTKGVKGQLESAFERRAEREPSGALSHRGSPFKAQHQTSKVEPDFAEKSQYSPSRGLYLQWTGLDFSCDGNALKEADDSGGLPATGDLQLKLVTAATEHVSQ